MRDELGANIKKLLSIQREADQESITDELFKAHLRTYLELWEDITKELMENPGQLVHFEDEKTREVAAAAVVKLWSQVDTDDFYWKIMDGDVGANLVGTYVERAKKLRPTFVSVEPTSEIRRYYSEAVTAWLYGLDCAALILCWSLIESMTRHALRAKKKDVEPGPGKLERLLFAAKDIGALTDQGHRDADTVRKLRNYALHRLRPVTAEECYDAILGTRRVIEDLLPPKQTRR